ncbi:UPF0716 protein FxsA [Tamaricihabitans halophyticus]|uniref:UPF0716 protein FxsA n=1 Tax=Tamaricihabitans halophyticus TaxID=1262583 RepID=A0A4R2R649_9PSEU|nr:FxsA family protein [Tamaricihabitans halophyticus]TCP57319.1 UPF0716 protein FxsA [Tamaricihabitans halophyticus]
MAVVLLLYLIVEIAAVVAVTSAVGLLWTLVLLFGGAVLGSSLARREGGKAMRALMQTANAGRAPHSEITDSMLIGLGGMLILLPGFVSDLFGFLMLLPPSRALIRKRWVKSLERRVHARQGGSMRATVVVDGEVVTEEPRSNEPDESRKPGDNGRGLVIDGSVVDDDSRKS